MSCYGGHDLHIGVKFSAYVCDEAGGAAAVRDTTASTWPPGFVAAHRPVTL